MDSRINILSKCALFKGVQMENIKDMISCLSANNKQYKKDEYIFSVGDIVSEIGIVLSGSINIIKEDFWGNRSIIAKMGEGDLFAEAFSCAKVDKIPISVIASENCEIMFFNYQKIATTCSSNCIFHNNIITNMIYILANKNIMLTQKMEHMSCRTTKDKLLSYLSAQAINAKSNNFHIPFNRQELADYLCVDRSAMSNELCKLRDNGIINFSKNSFELL